MEIRSLNSGVFYFYFFTGPISKSFEFCVIMSVAWPNPMEFFIYELVLESFEFE